jgi:hypothetical protein
MRQLRKTGDEQFATDRWQCDQARIQCAALNGELGLNTQLIAMSAAYGELMAGGFVDEARALKAQAQAVHAAQKGN